MATITRTVLRKITAKKLIAKCYEFDRSGGLSNEGLTFAGSVITATAVRNQGSYNSSYVVTIYSNYYEESTLERAIL